MRPWVLRLVGGAVLALGLLWLGSWVRPLPFAGWSGFRLLGPGQVPAAPVSAGSSGSSCGATASPLGSCCGGPAGLGAPGTATPATGSAGGAAPGAVAPGPGTLEASALAAYRGQTGDQAPVDVKVTDFGCHIQADVFKNGQRVRSYVLWNGQWVEVK